MSSRAARAARFSETMEGWLRRPGEPARRPFRFRIDVLVPGMRPFGTVTGRITGSVDVDGLVTAAPAAGSLEISPWERRRIRYVLEFRADDGSPLRFEGSKRISYLRPVHSWVTLPGVVEEGGHPWAGAELRFRLRTLPDFVAGFRVAPRVPRSAVGFSAALLGTNGDLREAEAVAARLTSMAARFPLGARAGLRAGMAGLDLAAWMLTGQRLVDLEPAERDRVIDRLAGRASLRRVVDILKTPVVGTHAATQAAASVLERALAGPVARPDPELDVTPAQDWPSTSRADVVVVGSGAGGAMAARTLARAGLSTVILEEGYRYTSEDFRTRAPLDRYAAMYRDGGATFALGNPPILLPLGRAVGGTTLVNSGTCYRTPGHVLRRWRDRYGLDLADPDAFAPYLDEVERTLMVAPVPAKVMGRNGEIALRGARALGWSAAPLRRNAPGCDGCCQCVVGCPHNAKFAVHLSVLPEACAAGARIVTGARVERVLRSDGRAVGVEVRRRDGSRLRIAADAVVVAAGATETPPLLRRSGLGGHPHLGGNLALHPAVSILGRFEEAVRSWDGVLQSVGVDEFHQREGILIEATSAPQGMAAASIPGYGRRLAEGLEAADRFASIGALVADGPGGRVHGRRRALIRYDLRPGDERRLLRAIEVMGRLLLAAGATEVHTGISGAGPARTPAELDERTAAADRRLLRLAAFHPTGTVRAGSDPERCPVDADGRLRGIRGVWVADASLLPSCPGVNPQVTIMAASLAVADRLLASA